MPWRLGQQESYRSEKALRDGVDPIVGLIGMKEVERLGAGVQVRGDDPAGRRRRDAFRGERPVEHAIRRGDANVYRHPVRQVRCIVGRRVDERTRQPRGIDDCAG